jgi:hypothetical protein
LQKALKGALLAKPPETIRSDWMRKTGMQENQASCIPALLMFSGLGFGSEVLQEALKEEMFFPSPSS